MFGWEFPPHNSGGLGVACEGLVKALAKQGEQVLFVLPRRLNHNCQDSSFRMIFSDDSNQQVGCISINSPLIPYISSQKYFSLLFENAVSAKFYGPDLFSEVTRYGQEAARIAALNIFDVIHSHDWLSIPAGLAARAVSGKPLVVHIHATEFDRSGGEGVNQRVYDIEREGMEKAQAVIAVSNFTKNKIVQHYGIDPGKIKVVYNATNEALFANAVIMENLLLFKEKGIKIVLFVGRITLQKGPDYFLRAAQKVLAQNPNVRFVVVGSGDMEAQMINLAAWLGIADKVFFLGFVDRERELPQVYKLADLYVMSSVSEPFGITPLEALASGVPVLISKQSGVAETLSHSLKVDFWDVDEMANKILAVLRYPSLKDTLSEYGGRELKRLSWRDSAKRCVEVYQSLVNA